MLRRNLLRKNILQRCKRSLSTDKVPQDALVIRRRIEGIVVGVI